MTDNILSVLSIVIMLSIFYKNRTTLKELTKFQLLGAAICYLFAILIAFVFVYYGGNWVAGQFSNTIFNSIIFIAVILIVLYPTVSILNKLLHKITNGILPKDK